MQLDRLLTYRLHLLHKVSDQDSNKAYTEQVGLSLSDARCLATVGAFQPMSVLELADKANLNKGQASRAAQILVDKGLVEKQNNPEDGRGVTLTLTPLGKKRWRQTMALIESRNHQIFACLSHAERDLLSQLLDHLIEHNRPVQR